MGERKRVSERRKLEEDSARSGVETGGTGGDGGGKLVLVSGKRVS